MADTRGYGNASSSASLFFGTMPYSMFIVCLSDTLTPQTIGNIYILFTQVSCIIFWSHGLGWFDIFLIVE